MSRWNQKKAAATLKRSPADRSPLVDEAGISVPDKKLGRPEIEIDVDKVRPLAAIQCTYEEIAAVLGIARQTFIDHVNRDPVLREAIDQGWANGRASFRRLQVKLLEAGNATMGVWLGKQYLGQRDQIGLTGGDGGAIKHAVDPFDILSAELTRVSERERADADTPQADA